MIEPSSRCVRAVVAAVVILLAATAAPALPTPTPTPPHIETPAGGATVSATPTPRPTAIVFPNPARSGQRVTLDASATVTVFSPQWSQIGGDVALQIADADTFVASFVAPPVSAPVSVRVRFALLSSDIISSLEFDITILPADVAAVTIGNATGPPGGLAAVEVTLDPVGLAVASLRHEMAFAPEAAVAAREDATPDCEAGPGIVPESARFEFLPAGCTATAACSAVRAVLVAAEPITAPQVVYRCRIGLTDAPADSCTHALRCNDGDATAADATPLGLSCTDGTALSAFAQRDPTVALRVEPPAPSVGDTVHLTFTVLGDGGIPVYQLIGSTPFLVGETVVHSSNFGDVPFTLQAQRAGSFKLQLGISYETTGGCPGQTYYFFRYALSPMFDLTVDDPNGVRVSGHVAEFPLGCQGAMRGVTVRLEPGGFSSQTDLVDGSFAFDGISPGEYALTVDPPCNPFGCWSPQDVRVGTVDQSLTVCPHTATCAGDCNNDQTVSIDELVAGVRLALGDVLPFACAAFDSDVSGVVRIEELIRAVHAALEGCGLGPGTTPSPTPPATIPPTPPATPTSCRAVVPVVAPVTSPTDALEQTIYLCGIYYASSLVSVSGPTGDSIELYESENCRLVCPDSRLRCRAANVPLLPGVVNTIEVCQVPGIGCTSPLDLCVDVEIEQRTAAATEP